MKITKAKLKQWHACRDGIEWFEETLWKSTDIVVVARKLLTEKHQKIIMDRHAARSFLWTIWILWKYLKGKWRKKFNDRTDKCKLLSFKRKQDCEIAIKIARYGIRLLKQQVEEGK
ncbi:MAG TPA: hypothetical protein ENI23_17820 [bacterium]|nr:hypothetical protein [bacterium]